MGPNSAPKLVWRESQRAANEPPALSPTRSWRFCWSGQTSASFRKLQEASGSLRKLSKLGSLFRGLEVSWRAKESEKKTRENRMANRKSQIWPEARLRSGHSCTSRLTRGLPVGRINQWGQSLSAAEVWPKRGSQKRGQEWGPKGLGRFEVASLGRRQRLALGELVDLVELEWGEERTVRGPNGRGNGSLSGRLDRAVCLESYCWSCFIVWANRRRGSLVFEQSTIFALCQLSSKCAKVALCFPTFSTLFGALWGALRTGARQRQSLGLQRVHFKAEIELRGLETVSKSRVETVCGKCSEQTLSFPRKSSQLGPYLDLVYGAASGASTGATCSKIVGQTSLKSGHLKRAGSGGLSLKCGHLLREIEPAFGSAQRAPSERETDSGRLVQPPCTSAREWRSQTFVETKGNRKWSEWWSFCRKRFGVFPF